MQQKKKILFVLNPIAGTKFRKNINHQILKYLDTDRYDADFQKSKYPRHAFEIAQNYISKGYDAIIAVGGDGTVNEVGRALIHSDISLGIVPVGSGNGLARHLKIPISIRGAVKLINRMKLCKIDSLQINDAFVFCAGGLGFDAQVSKVFAGMNKRGLISYVKVSLQMYRSTKEQEFQIKSDGIKKNLKGFMLCFANASQFGNEAYLAPSASVSDGLMNLILIKKPSILQVPIFALRVFTKTVHKSKLWQEFIGKEFFISQQGDLAHCDGEPKNIGHQIRANVQPASLNVIS